MQLCGSQGKIIATDGQQALVQAGFTFPWTEEDLLVPASNVFGCRELPGDQPLHVRKTADWATFKTGPWTISLRLEKEARFPESYPAPSAIYCGGCPFREPCRVWDG